MDIGPATQVESTSRIHRVLRFCDQTLHLISCCPQITAVCLARHNWVETSAFVYTLEMNFKLNGYTVIINANITKHHLV